MQRTLEDEYRQDWEELPNLQKGYIADFLGGDYPQHQEYIEEILRDTPGYWKFEKFGFKKMRHVSPNSVESIVNGKAVEEANIEEGIDGLERPKMDGNADYYTYVSYFLDAMEELFEEEITEMTGSNYDIEDLGEDHVEAVKQIVEDYSPYKKD